MNFKKIRSVGLSLSLFCAAIIPATTASALDPTDTPEIESIIRDYLLKNPEIMLEVQQALEQKQQQEAKDRARLALASNAEAIFNSPNQGTIGNPDGDITIVEFFDYNCGFCQRAMNDMNALLETDSNLKFVMKELPILSEGSVEASRISTAVYRLFPEKYAEFHNRLLGNQGLKDGNRALRVAQEMDLNIDAINTESQKNDVLGAFREANELATSLGINGTPSYVIGDEVIFGALGEAVLRSKIENIRNCGKTVCS